MEEEKQICEKKREQRVKSTKKKRVPSSVPYIHYSLEFLASKSNFDAFIHKRFG